jgi:hypothetical protein
MPRQKAELVGEFNRAISIWEEERPDLAYMATVFAQTGLPYRDPGPLARWGRRDGHLSLLVQPGEYFDELGEVRSVGIPYGVIPRLLLAWMTTEAKRTHERRMVLGDSLSEFMQGLALGRGTGGRWGSITRLREQMNRLFLASVFVRYDSTETQDVGARINIVDEYNLWWSAQSPGQQTLMPSYVELSERFYSDVLEHALPLKLEVLYALRQSPMRIDLYLWLIYRLARLRAPTTIRWEHLQRQFATQLADTKDGRKRFREHFQNHLRIVLMHYPEARVEATTTGLVLRPSSTHVRRRAQ